MGYWKRKGVEVWVWRWDGMGVPHCLNAHGGRAEVEVIEEWV